MIYNLPLPLAGEKLSLALPIDSAKWAYRVVAYRVADGLRIQVLRKETAKNLPIEYATFDIGGYEGTHHECCVWLSGWLSAMAVRS